MKRKPRDDTGSADPPDTGDWQQVLAHRTAAADRSDAAARFRDAGLDPSEVDAVLRDGGDALFAAAAGPDPDWAEPFGGLKAAALLAAELSSLAAALNSRASGIRSAAVALLLEDYSAVSVARELGISRQKVYEVGRAGFKPPYVETVPWKRS
ncbi:hypothetical protein H9639_01700 [Arthrobacter sp. Sa2CUA1]|uniref:Uncharacterized protein n=1 Tax=Arthrobacter gallicola TaxID=2762225 RepID=A0ABR8UP60_9MICC|nr:hypothetical protein [Arthrobacter gallicola]MBD7994011.1 hypothetical protein [Arthrobacter gallicola]